MDTDTSPPIKIKSGGKPTMSAHTFSQGRVKTTRRQLPEPLDAHFSSDVTPHVLRHSFASIANDLGFTEVTIAALVSHAKGSVTANTSIRLTALIIAADTISGYIQGPLDSIEFKQTAYALDRDSRKAALARFLKRASYWNCLSDFSTFFQMHLASLNNQANLRSSRRLVGARRDV